LLYAKLDYSSSMKTESALQNINKLLPDYTVTSQMTAFFNL
jgi:hypothetical protein